MFMRKNAMLLLIVLITLFLGACAPKAKVWHKANTTREAMELELAQCRYEVELSTPPALSYYTPLTPHWQYFGPRYKRSKSHYDRDVLRFWARVAAREALREEEYQRYYRVKRLVNLCMEARGWHLLPEDVFLELERLEQTDENPQPEGNTY